MKLTNAIRDAFVRQAMDDVPQVDYTEAIRTTAMAAALDALPKSVRQLWDDPKSRDYIRTRTCWFGNVGVVVPVNSTGSWGRDADPAISAKSAKTISDLATKKEAQDETRKSLEAKLRGAANACSTRKALADMLPEFAKYLPADDAAANRTLPVVANIVADFAKAGWPKGKKMPKAAKVEA